MINVVFVNKSTQKVTSVKMDYIKSPQSNCTVMDIEGDDPKFRECSIWKEGSTTSAPEISKFCADNEGTFDAYVCDGYERKSVDEYWAEFEKRVVNVTISFSGDTQTAEKPFVISVVFKKGTVEVEKHDFTINSASDNSIRCEAPLATLYDTLEFTASGYEGGSVSTDDEGVTDNGAGDITGTLTVTITNSPE